MNRKSTSFLATLPFLIACSGSPAGSAAGAATTTPAAAGTPAQPASPPTVKDTASALPSELKAGASYAAVRAALVAAHWLPLRTPQCRTNVGGDAPVCNALPETDSCSGDGHCVMHFVELSRTEELTLQAYGNAEQWNTNGREGEFSVTSWSVAKPTPMASAACPSPAFEGFLQAFAAKPTVRAAFTAPFVQAAELHSDADGDHLADVAYAAGAYDRFNLGFDGHVFHHIDADGGADKSPLAVDIQPDGPDGETVRYQYGMSEGRAFHFQHVDNCWRLTRELPPPLD